MADPRVEGVARILVDYSVDVQPGQFVLIEGSPEGKPLILAVYQRVLERGGHPWLQLGLDEAAEILYKVASDEQLDFLPDIARQFVEEILTGVKVPQTSALVVVSAAAGRVDLRVGQVLRGQRDL